MNSLWKRGLGGCAGIQTLQKPWLTSDQARSLTALWMDTTVRMSPSLGRQSLRCMALKNICSLGYIHTRPPGSWCPGGALSAAPAQHGENM